MSRFFSVLAGIIPLSLRNGGHLIPFAPLSASGGPLTPLPPALQPMEAVVESDFYERPVVLLQLHL